MDLIGLYFFLCYLRDYKLIVLELNNLYFWCYCYYNNYVDFVDLNNFDFFDMYLYLDLMDCLLLYYMMS